MLKTRKTSVESIRQNKIKRELYYRINNDDVISSYMRYLRSTAGIRLKDLVYDTFKTTYRLDGDQTEILFFNYRQRADYLSLFDSIYDACDLSKSKLNVITHHRLNTSNILRFFYLLSKRKVIQSIIINNFDGFVPNRSVLNYTILFLLKMYSFRDAAYSFPFDNCKVLFVLSETSFEIELIKMANSFEIQTICGAHGQSVMSTAQIEEFYSDYMYDSSIPRFSKNYFTWCSSDGCLIKRLVPHINFFVCGNPLLSIPTPAKTISSMPTISFVADGGYYDIKKMSSTEQYGYKSSSIEMGNYFRYTNEAILDILSKYAKKNNLKIRLRLHPNARKVENIHEYYHYDPELFELNENLDDVDLIIMHFSSMFVQCSSLGKNILVYDSPLYGPSLDIDSSFLFDSLESLEEKITLYSEIGFPKETGCISATGEESINLYRDSFRLVYESK